MENADAPWQRRPQVIEVQIDYFSFMPNDITVAAGATVMWVNEDGLKHHYLVGVVE